MSYAEEKLIASLLLKPKKILDCKCSPDDFSSTKFRDIFLAIRENLDGDYLAISKSSGVSPAEICKLADDIIPVGIRRTALTVASDASKRRLIEGMREITTDKTLASGEMLAELLRLYRSEQGRGDKNYSIASVLGRFNDVQQVNIRRGSLGLRTGFHFLDSKMIHLVPGHMWVIGALPGVGKTNTLIQLICNLSCRVLVFSTEMTEEQLVSRYLANKTGVDSKVILSGAMIKIHQEKVDEEKEILKNNALTIIDDVKEINEIERIIRLENMKKPVDVVFIDYVQQLKIKARTKYEGASDICHIIQDLAKSCRLTMVCFSQVTITSHKEYTGNAQFKGAGDFAEDCDLGVRLMSHNDLPGKIKWITEKNRHGVRPEQVLEYKDNYTRLEEIEFNEER